MRAVIDTNVLLEGLTHLGPSAKVLDLWVSERFRPHVSTALALEYRDVLARRLRPDRAERALRALQALLGRSVYTPIWFSFRPSSPDPGDDLVIDCALNARAIIVTSNLRDFRLCVREHGLTVLPPNDFLAYLEEIRE